MGRVNYEDVEKYSTGNRNTFFGLADDGDSAIVRFRHVNMNDIPMVACHTVALNNGERKVNCIREYDEPVANCPLCAAGSRISVRTYLEMDVYETDSKGNLTGKFTTQIWDRGKQFNRKLVSLVKRFEPLCDYLFTIERNGAKGSNDTTYEIYNIAIPEGIEFAELPAEAYDPVGTIVLDKNFNELQEYVDTGAFPENTDEVVKPRESARPVAAPEPEPRSYRQQSVASAPVTARRRI